MYQNETVERMMKEYGRCLPLTMPGGYTIIYFDNKDNVLCSECATKQPKGVKEVRTYDEGSPIDCSGCNTEIESSYGDTEYL